MVDSRNFKKHTTNETYMDKLRKNKFIPLIIIIILALMLIALQYFMMDIIESAYSDIETSSFENILRDIRLM